jgi:2-keto-4-pentenoate hydratase/2-oxohepta-3-ene-1,7-dioic acid hydratase in catechol pathway/ketosteroid isomerase-like protein
MTFRLATTEDGIVVGRDGRAAPLPGAPADLRDVIADWPRWRARAAAVAAGELSLAEEDLRFRAPLVPAKLVCVGANYDAHNREMLGELEQPFPYTFLKPPTTTVVPTGAAVPYPRYASKLDYEAELAVVLGAGGEVFGYTLCNDLSVRDWVPAPNVLGIDWVAAKGFDGSAPLGPWITPAEFVADPQDLGIRLWVNGELRQDARTSDMVFGVREVLAHLRRVMTLEPGDVVATGTPPGVGMGSRPPRFLAPGDVVRMEIEGLGTLETGIATQEEERVMAPSWLREYYADVDGMRMDAYLAHHTDDVVVRFANNPEAHGKEQVRAGIGHFWELIDGLRHEFVNVFEDGDTTIAEALIDYTRKDGQVVTIPCTTLLHRRGELVDSVRVYLDVAPIFAPAQAETEAAVS